MSLIIAATNFTEVAQNAVKYAAQLASAQKAQLLILHSYSIPVVFSDIAVPTAMVDDAQSDAEEQMKNVVNEMANAYTGLDVKGRIVYGDTIDMLDQFEEEARPVLIVVGNSMAGDSDSWLDSTLMDEFRKIKCPVLAVPSGTAYSPVQKICLAFDNKHTGNDVALQQLTRLSTELNAALHVINIAHDESSKEIDALAIRQLAGTNVTYHTITGTKDVDGAIRDFARSNEADWLALIPRKYSFFEGLFHKSHTKAIAQHTHLPILALHEQE